MAPRCSLRLVMVAALAAACADPASEEGVERREQPIIGGTVDTGDPAVVAIYYDDPTEPYICSGTLISRKVVLTAAHCLNEGPTLSRYEVYFGTTVLEYDTGFIGSRSVRAISYHPSFDGDNLAKGFDIGLLELVSPAPAGVTPRPINRTLLGDSYVGQTVRVVGWGITRADRNDEGVKRQVTTTLADHGYACLPGCSPVLILDDPTKNICQGDSGGPHFMFIDGVEVTAGITSAGDENCTIGDATDVSHFATSYIDPWVAAHDTVSCGSDGACASGCSSPDPDCPCNADSLCTTACHNTDTDPDCPQGCPRNGTCVQGCPAPDPDCSDEPDPCGADSSCVAGCVTRDPDCPPAAMGEACDTGGDCQSTICLPAQDDPRLRYCTGFCDPASASSCPQQMTCVAASGGQHVCVYPAPTPGALGSSCTGASDCIDRLCVPVGDESLCLATCNDSACPDGYDCVAASGGNSVCVPAGGDGDSGFCAVAAGGRRGPGAWLLAVALMVLVTAGAAARPGARRAGAARRSRRRHRE